MKVLVGFSIPKKFNIISYLICKSIKTKYSHSYIRLDFDKLDREVIYEASHGEVHFQSAKTWDEKNKIIKEYALELDNLQYKTLLQFCVDNSNKPYGMLSLVGFLLKNKLGNDGDKTFVCSELVAKAIGASNLDKYSPKDLYDYMENHYGKIHNEISG